MDVEYLIKKYCLTDDLRTYDPYDIWTTKAGFFVKKLFNHNRKVGILPAALLTIFDTFLNNKIRLFYKEREYPVVRAFAAQILLNLYEKKRDQCLLSYAKKHLEWLAENPCEGFHGCCWGLGWKYPVSRNLVYGENTPLSTVTPYALEAFIKYSKLAQDSYFDDVIKRIFWFFEEDIQILKETKEHLITSYSAMSDRIAYNAISYSMYSLALLLEYIQDNLVEKTQQKIKKMYSYISDNQASDGSWYYSPEGQSFIDCYHSCFVLKNIYKTNMTLSLCDSNRVVTKGYSYLINNLYDEKMGLFRRFSIKNKPGIIKYDLYDNAEMLNLAILLKDNSLIVRLTDSIKQHFCFGFDIYSQIDVLGIKRNKNTLRWAVMPYLYALSES